MYIILFNNNTITCYFRNIAGNTITGNRMYPTQTRVPDEHNTKVGNLGGHLSSTVAPQNIGLTRF